MAWDELRADIASIKDTLAAAQRRALDILARPEWDDGGANYVRAYRAAFGGVEAVLPRVEALIALLAASAAPPAPVSPFGAEETGRIIQAAIAWQRRRDQLPGGLEPQDEADELERAVKAMLAAGGPAHPLDQIADAFAGRRPAEPADPLAREVRAIRGFEVEFELDGALGTWHFRCPAMDVVGGGQFTLEDAIRVAGEAIDLAMEPVTHYDPDSLGDVVCQTPRVGRTSPHREEVTCPACLEWLARNLATREQPASEPPEDGQ